MPACHSCKRPLRAGEIAYTSDWHVIEPEGVRMETRYKCGACAAQASTPVALRTAIDTNGDSDG